MSRHTPALMIRRSVIVLLLAVARFTSGEMAVAPQSGARGGVDGLIARISDRAASATPLREVALESTALAKPRQLLTTKPLSRISPGLLPARQKAAFPGPLPAGRSQVPLLRRSLKATAAASDLSLLRGCAANWADPEDEDDSSDAGLGSWGGRSRKESPRIVVLGGGFGGLYTALALAKMKWDRQNEPEITLVDSEERFLFKPLMYELISGEATIDQVAPRMRDMLKHTGVRFVHRLATSVILADPEKGLAGRVSTEDFKIDYDWIVLGVGATTNMDFAPGARDHALPFWTLDDVRRLESELKDLEKRAAADGRVVDVSVVGGGASGVEIAATVAQRLWRSIGSKQTRVSMYVLDPEIMPTFAISARKAAEKSLEAKGVNVYYNHAVERVSIAEADGTEGNSYMMNVRVRGNETGVKEVFTNLVLWTAGAKPVQVEGLSFTALKGSEVIETGRGYPIIVEPSLKVQGREREFAVGDVAGLGYPATAQVAMQQAGACARNVWASITGRKLRDFRYFHLGNLVALGTLEGTATLPVGGVTFTGPLASAMRKAAYIYRQPTVKQQIKVGIEWMGKPELWWPAAFVAELRAVSLALGSPNPLAGSPLLWRLYDEGASEEIEELFRDVLGKPREKTPKRPYENTGV